MKTRLIILVLGLVFFAGNLPAQEKNFREEIKILKGDQFTMQLMDPDGILPPPIPGLTKDQEEKMKQIDMDFRKFSLPLKNEIKIKEAQLNALRSSDNPDMTAINKLVEEIGAINTKIAKENELNHQKIRKLLDDSQRVIFDSQGNVRRIERRIKIDGDKEPF
ncbi:MAG TPA: hypothetical protein PLT92_08280 [Ignavibacteriaceae bacterium]|nr:hypothetical protein [Ignavibacteriaceae bacterium]